MSRPPGPPPAPAPSPEDWRAAPDAPARGQALCVRSEIADPGAREFVFGVGRTPFRMIALRRGARVLGYVNRCPHASMPLNHRPDEFLSSDGAHLMCRRHFALFRWEDGLCVSGASAGARLTPIPLRVRDDGMIEVS